jgi:hypothetical protein
MWHECQAELLSHPNLANVVCQSERNGYCSHCKHPKKAHLKEKTFQNVW